MILIHSFDWVKTGNTMSPLTQKMWNVTNEAEFFVLVLKKFYWKNDRLVIVYLSE